MKQIVLATNNEHKIREISYILRDLPLSILSKKDFSDFPEAEETGQTLEDNAILKAKAIFKVTNVISVADDSGLEVAALEGRPGVNSARYAGPGCSFEDNNRKLLRELEGVPESERDAVFRCVIAVCFAEDDLELVEGRVTGKITTEIRGREGFGYDPVFFLPFYGKTFAELPPEEKNKISHRAIATNRARDLLIKRLNLDFSAG
ncbi:MAG: XTP/dITP diphosphatase [candidate division Zixibacteria bacterium]|nr:XTP/dITP diphosphatase [candidate division Zixibacteria bacterium]NIR64869.1 XTP/dITP diphosphatase [candidate division Zixibacteria bacterium]NIS17664.1 XTP/dITP diphosphatase [candidate division Zixibacteria bacterium]NIS46685.1 XTP/dITP diphosphatase [candidate division Zixibacteria bacterium]NIT53982.1 XTP/dITP diphosphatase [candidate division Zixibacteria bacterium]